MEEVRTKETEGERSMKMRIRMHWLVGAALFAVIAGDRLLAAGEEPLVEKYVLAMG